MESKKRCNKCNIEKPATTDYFHPDKKLKCGLRATCIVCRTGKERQYKREGQGSLQNKASNRLKRRNTLHGFIADNLHNSIRSRHKTKWGTESDLTVDYLVALWEQQKGLCYWTGIELQYGSQLPIAHVSKLSFDRLDCNLGYVQGNIVLASNFANRGRGNMDAEEYRNFLVGLGISK